VDIRGQAALVTGAGSGIGRAFAMALAERGATRLVMLDIDEVGLAVTARQVVSLGAQAMTRRTDLADLDDLAAAYDAAAADDYAICFNNAGIVPGLPNFPETCDARIDQVIRVDLTAVVVGTRRAIRHLSARGGGVIVNTGSTAAVNPVLDDIPYRVAKAGVHYLTDCCRSLAQSAGVRVNAIHPGGTDTPILAKLGGDGRAPAWAQDRLRTIRLWTAREIAEAAMGLVEDDRRAGENLVLQNQSAEAV
jgi:3-oxoacyl-[acyl-carrier protein] reductase